MYQVLKHYQLVTLKNISLQSKVGQLLITIIITAFFSGCVSTAPKMGDSGGSTVTGGAGGASAAGENSGLEKCDQTLGTLTVFEDKSLGWWQNYNARYPKMGSTIPVIRLMIQQSNCFVIVERGKAMAAMNRERQLMQSGQLRGGSNIGGGQMVAADFTLSPEIQFAAQGTKGMKAAGGSLFGGLGALIGGGLSKNEASTTLLLIENRSGVQVSAAVGSAGNYDFNAFGGFFGGGTAGGASGFSKTPEGKVITAAFADSFNQMVKALRVYKAQVVKGGLGKGGTLQIGGNEDKMPTATDIDTNIVSQAPAELVDVEPEPVEHTVSAATHTVSTKKNYNFEVDEYDEKALKDYYNLLTKTAPLVSGLASVTSKNDTHMRNSLPFLTTVVGQLESYAIEIEAWPMDAKQEAWKVLGKRIEKHSEIFERNRKLALKNEEIDPDVRERLASIRLLTKDSLFAE